MALAAARPAVSAALALGRFRRAWWVRLSSRCTSTSSSLSSSFFTCARHLTTTTFGPRLLLPSPHSTQPTVSWQAGSLIPAHQRMLHCAAGKVTWRWPHAPR